MLEQHVPGDDHRLMVIDGRLVAAVRRDPPQLVGDGLRTVSELVEALNCERSVGLRRSRYRRPLALDAVVEDMLARQGLNPSSVPQTGRRVLLRSNANVSTGGTAADVTENLHPSIRNMAEQIAATLGLRACGVDFISTDRSRDPAEGGCAFIEVNAVPGLDLLVMTGWSEEQVGRMILGDSCGRIPFRMEIFRDAGQLRTLRSRAQADSEAGEALVAGATVLIDGALLTARSDEPWPGVLAALKNRKVRSVRLFRSAAEIMRNALPVDRCDRITVDWGRLDEEWNRTLRRHCGDLAVV